MAQLFSPRADVTFRLVIAIALLAVFGVAVLAYWHVRSPAYWNVGTAAAQPIPFRHDLHAGELQLDCRFCHSSVEKAAFAGMPSAQTCLTCHSQVWRGAGVLEPLRSAQALDQPVRWTSVHRLPDHVHFAHAPHIAKGVACQTCHGRVDEMRETAKAATMSMGWCLDCHRDPAPHLGKPENVFAFHGEGAMVAGASSPPKPEASGTPRLMSCNLCHR